MQLAEVADASAEVAATASRSAKAKRLADVLAAAPAEEAAVVVAWLSGDLPQRQIGVGWAALRHLPAPAPTAALSVATVHAAFDAIKALSGPGSQSARTQQLADLFAAATPTEQDFLRRLLSGELRQGAQNGVMTEAVAQAADVPLPAVRRAAMLRGGLPQVAAAARRGGAAELAGFRLQVGRAIGPMLAQTAADPADALRRLGGEAIFEAKLDGVRIQIHRHGARVAIFTRTLEEITDRLPEIVEWVGALPISAAVLDAEALAVRPNGRPHRFQVTAARFGRRVDVPAAAAERPLRPFVFDVLHLDGEDLLDQPTTARLARLDQILPAQARVPRVTTGDAAAAEAFLGATLAAGHEGVMAKAPNAPYAAGRRGAAWVKIKPVHTLDLVVLAVEWGSGRRGGLLSNIHLGARDPANGGFVMLGKTFKGMTDQMLAWQTARFTELAVGPTDGYVVWLRPEQVVEVAFDGVQRSTRYPSGLALRFARVIRYRDDKRASEADTIEAVRALEPD